MQTTTIGSNQAGQRLDKFLHKYLPNAGSGFLYKMLRKRNITLNGRKAEGSELLKEGDLVCCFFSQETFERFAGRTVQTENASGKTAQTESTPGKTGHTEGVSGKLARVQSEKASGEPGQTGRLPGKPERSGNLAANTSEYERAYGLLGGIQVVYEDDHFLFLNKPAGVLTQKARPEDSSLNEWMIGYLLGGNPSLANDLSTFRPSVCNRLDRNTSGIVLCGKTLGGLQFLSRQVRERSLQKFYHTICVGELKESDRVQGYLEKDEKINKVRITMRREPGLGQESGLGQGQTAMQRTGSGQKQTAMRQSRSAQADYIETGYTPLGVRHGYTYLEVELITGKTHQIRAHLASIGHPLIGDFKYGEDRVNRRLKQEYGLSHQLLHACRIVFPEIGPGVGSTLSGCEFTAPEPELFVRVRAGLGL